MTDYHLGENLLTLYAQLTPWVQAWIGLSLCLVLLGVVYLLKEIVVALMQPFRRSQSLLKAPENSSYEECQQLQLKILHKLDRLLTRSILNLHLGIR
ncbi:hypothetical protein [Pseudochelatococcus sp. G4_1912]|uniref:hypothetical protein n=1 Tax=Pseudochelatococcus sp. G4_1912 TaxID=3114288 RepID=UPI0039C705EE